jgi:F-type H+-transporting ATPase subunit gamma
MIYRCILDSLASEHAARMIAMQNATDNANELVDDLTLDLNKARQETITSELLDLVGGMSAIKN